MLSMLCTKKFYKFSLFVLCGVCVPSQNARYIVVFGAPLSLNDVVIRYLGLVIDKTRCRFRSTVHIDIRVFRKERKG